MAIMMIRFVGVIPEGRENFMYYTGFLLFLPILF